jgi:hypothetical protein
MKKRWATSPTFTDGVRKATASAEPPSNVEAEIRITEWLARLQNLHGVPFYLLVPDVRMLPQESIRMFRLDENWIECLVDGAFSLGRATTGDAIAEVPARVSSRERANYARIRPRIRQQAATRRVRRVFGAEHVRAAATAAGVETGFLMRSAVVSGWPTLEVRGYDASGAELRVMRIDRPASDILFCLFDGEAAKVSLSEPAETLHFGFVIPLPDSQTFTKNLKYVDAAGHAPGSLIPDVKVNVPMRDAANRVVAVDSLANAIHQALVAAGAMPSSAPYTTAELALELIQGVQQVDFTIGEPA